MSRPLAILTALALLFASAVAAASPSHTQWVEDVHVQPAGTVELGLGYEYQGMHAAALGAGFQMVDLRLRAGVDAGALELSPHLRLRQRGNEATQMDALGLRARYLLAGAPARLLVFGGYDASLAAGHEQRFEQGAAASWATGSWALTGALGLRESLWGEAGTRVELRAAAAATAGMGHAGWLRLGLESFALVPLLGDRLSDPVFGATKADINVYAGPTLRVRVHDLWAGVSAVSGFLRSGTSLLLVRATVGVRL